MNNFEILKICKWYNKTPIKYKDEFILNTPIQDLIKSIKSIKNILKGNFNVFQNKTICIAIVKHDSRFINNINPENLTNEVYLSILQGNHNNDVI